MRIFELERSLYNMHKELRTVMDKVEIMGVVKHDMVKMDATVAMVSELARRIDFIGIPKLPDECVCETCGCKR
jgi:S-adenosylmethionine synthetase